MHAGRHYTCVSVVFMGGILINGDYDVGSFCEVRRFVEGGR